MDNRTISRHLRMMGQLCVVEDDTPYRASRFHKAAEKIRSWPVPLADLPAVDDLISTLHVDLHIDKQTATSVYNLLFEGEKAAFAALSLHIPVSVRELMELPGVGPMTARRFIRELGVTSLEELEASLAAPARSQHFSVTQTARLRTEITALRRRKSMVPLAWGIAASAELLSECRTCKGIVLAEITGELRRSTPAGTSLCLIAGYVADDYTQTCDDLRSIGYQLLSDQGLTVHQSQQRELAGTLCLRLHSEQETVVQSLSTPQLFRKTVDYDGREAPVYLWLALASLFAPTWVATSGDVSFTEVLQHMALLAKNPITIGKTSLPITSPKTVQSANESMRDEARVFSLLGIPLLAPELREGVSLVHAQDKLLERVDMRGDLHMHTDASDGRNSLEDMVRGCLAKGYEYLVITDHSRSLKIANGLSVDRLLRQREEILLLRERYPAILILHGTEVDILASRDLDFPDEILSELDLVVASIHTGFTQKEAELTARLLYAIEHPHVDVIAHPTGRMLGRRDGYPLSFDRVVAAAAGGRIALELNSNPSRLDLDPELVRRARSAGCLFAVDSDAHSVSDLSRVDDFGVIMARKGWLASQQILNTRAPDVLRAWLHTPKHLRSFPPATTDLRS